MNFVIKELKGLSSYSYMNKIEVNKMGEWLNTKTIIIKDIEKPCHKLKYCPYGQMVEEFKIRSKRNKFSCKTFGHDCPVFYHAENMAED